MHITIAIPSFNRAEYLKKNIAAIMKLNLTSNIKLSICVANSASTDDTRSYLDELAKKNQNVFIFNAQLNDENRNMGCLSSIIPDDVDWVWFLGDDDIIVDPDAILKINNLVSQENFSFVHVTQYRRSKNTKKIVSGSLEELCNEFGYTDILGWISSLVVKRCFFVQALKEAQKKITSEWNRVSAFNQSFFLYKQLFNKKCAFFDAGLVDPQDLKQTKESIKRWAHENMPARYLLVIDDLLELNEMSMLPPKINTIFFRYLNINLWDRWLIYLLNETIRNDIDMEIKLSKKKLAEFNYNWEKLMNFCELLVDVNVKKYVLNTIKTSMGLCIKYLFDPSHQDAYRTFIVDHINLLNRSVYDFKSHL